MEGSSLHHVMTCYIKNGLNISIALFGEPWEQNASLSLGWEGRLRRFFVVYPSVQTKDENHHFTLEGTPSWEAQEYGFDEMHFMVLDL